MASDPSPYLAPATSPEVCVAYAALAERARDAVWGFEDEIVFVDIETTGFDATCDAIIEIGAISARGPEITGRFVSLVDPGCAVPERITALTGITDEAVAGAPGVDEAVARLLEFVDGRDVVAHNVAFDRAFLEPAAGALGRSFSGAWIDSLELARIALPRMRTHRLADLARAFGLPAANHRALEDAEALATLWRIMLAGLNDLPPTFIAALARIAPEQSWSLRPILAHHAAAYEARALDLRVWRTERAKATGRRSPFIDAEELPLEPLEPGVAGAEMSVDGLAGAMYPSYEPRDEQSEMAEAVARSLSEGQHLALEAGTGVGKSVAYLVPALLFSMRNRVGVGVATKTNALLDQLVNAELPALAAAFERREGAADVPFRYVALKGYSHYPCLRKLDRALHSPVMDGASPAIVGAVLAWVGQSDWDDLDSLNIHWSADARTALVCSADDCTKKRCRYFSQLCYVHGSRLRAASAHVVVTNHALLFRDTAAGNEILPPIRHWIVDEAHGAHEEARKQLSLQCVRPQIAAALASLASQRGGPVPGLRQAAAALEGPEELELDAAIMRIQEESRQAATIVESLFESAVDLPIVDSRGPGIVDVRLAPRDRDSVGWSVVAGIARSALRHLEAVLDAGARLLDLTADADD